MNQKLKFSKLITGLALYCGLPLLFYALGDFPRRNGLKESFSLLFLVMFSLMLGLFFLSRSNRSLLTELKMFRVLRIHKFIGYLAVATFMLHPVLLVIPRYFEASVDPREAFLEIFTRFDNSGIILGLIAYTLMLILGITALLRKKLPLRYTSWRLFHGIMVMLFVVSATWHVLLMGRHINPSFTIYFLVLALVSKLALSKTYLAKPLMERS